MRASHALLFALPALGLTDNTEVPFVDRLRGWFNQATQTIQSAASQIPNPIDAGPSKVAELKVANLTKENWRDVIVPDADRKADGPEEWMVFITGGNSTCLGFCGQSEKAWNESVAALASKSNPPHLAKLDCETQPILCNQWAFVGVPCIAHILLPKPLPGQSAAYAPTVRSIPLNKTAVRSSDIVELSSASQSKYEAVKPYEGIFHPWTGFLNQGPLGEYIATAIFWIAKVPNWAFMIVISLASRKFMTRMPRPSPQQQQQPPAPQSGRRAARPRG